MFWYHSEIGAAIIVVACMLRRQGHIKDCKLENNQLSSNITIDFVPNMNRYTELN